VGAEGVGPADPAPPYRSPETVPAHRRGRADRRRPHRRLLPGRALKTEGVTFDAFATDPDVTNYPLEALTVPTLIVHAKDDPLVSYAAAQRVAYRIPGARLVSMERAGACFSAIGRTSAGEVAAYLAGPDAP
jgi:pimeloyl-ACP methyl ester carboxylesterase